MRKTNDEKSTTLDPDFADVFPLPVRVLPEPWEDLASLLSRSAVEMGYKHVNWLLRPEDRSYRWLGRDVCFLFQDETYQYLEHLLQLSKEELYKLTLHRFLLQMQTPEEKQTTLSGCRECPLFPSLGHAIRKLFLSKSATRVCPRCLAEEPAYGLLCWNFGPVVSCLKHHIFLVDCCPLCQGPIPRLRSILTRCPCCNSGDYRLAPSVKIPEEPLFLSSQAMILAHLGIEEECREGVPTEYGESPIHGLKAWQFFQLLKSFWNVLGPFFPNHLVLQTVAGLSIPSGSRTGSKLQLSLGEWVSFVLTFRTLFASWPDNFISLLESLQSVRSHTTARRGISEHFGELYLEYLYKRLSDPVFDFLREVFENYLKKQYSRGRVTSLHRPFSGMDSTQIVTECTYLTQIQAMKLLGIREHHLHALIKRGEIRAQKNPVGTKGKMSLWLIVKEDLEALLEEWRDLIPIEVFAQVHLGVSKEQVLALTKAGLLLPTRGPKIDRYNTWHYKSDEIERLKSILLQYARKDVADASKWISLSNSARRTGIPLVETIKAILSGHLFIIDTQKEDPLFQRFVLSYSEVKRFLVERLKAERSELNLLSTDEVMERLGVGEVALKNWLKQGVLVGKNQIITGKIHGYLFQKEMIDSFRNTYVYTKEAAELLNVTTSSINHYAALGILHPVCLSRPRLFLRKEVEALIPPSKLNLPQAAVFLDLPKSKL
jgi:hypothetical protein